MERLEISRAHLSIKWAFKTMIKFQLYETAQEGNFIMVFSLGLGLKVVKIAWNVAKVGVHACLFNEHPNL